MKILNQADATIETERPTLVIGIVEPDPHEVYAKFSAIQAENAGHQMAKSGNQGRSSSIWTKKYQNWRKSGIE